MPSTQFESQARDFPRGVFFTGSTKLEQGQLVCCERDFVDTVNLDDAAATDPCGWRDNRVELPGATNNRYVFGVTECGYAAKATGQEIRILEPGSVCMVALAKAVAIGDIVTASAGPGDPGRFGDAGFQGRGTARILQTVTDGVLTTARALDGSANLIQGTSGLYDTITLSAAFGDVVAGDTVHILGGASSTGTDVVDPGEYTVAEVLSAGSIVLDRAAGTAAGKISFYCRHGNPVALAELLDGPESGLTEWVTPIAGTAVNPMVGGVTFIAGGYTPGSDSTGTLATTCETGMKKAFKQMGTLTTNDYVVSPSPAGVRLDGSSALATIEFDAANDWYEAEKMSDGKWHGRGLSGAAEG